MFLAAYTRNGTFSFKNPVYTKDVVAHAYHDRDYEREQLLAQIGWLNRADAELADSLRGFIPRFEVRAAPLHPMWQFRRYPDEYPAMQIRASTICHGEFRWEESGRATFDNYAFPAPDYLAYMIAYPPLKEGVSLRDGHEASTRYRIVTGCVARYTQSQVEPTDEVQRILNELEPREGTPSVQGVREPRKTAIQRAMDYNRNKHSHKSCCAYLPLWSADLLPSTTASETADRTTESEIHRVINCLREQCPANRYDEILVITGDVVSQDKSGWQVTPSKKFTTTRHVYNNTFVGLFDGHDFECMWRGPAANRRAGEIKANTPLDPPQLWEVGGELEPLQADIIERNWYNRSAGDLPTRFVPNRRPEQGEPSSSSAAAASADAPADADRRFAGPVGQEASPSPMDVSPEAKASAFTTRDEPEARMNIPAAEVPDLATSSKAAAKAATPVVTAPPATADIPPFPGPLPNYMVEPPPSGADSPRPPTGPPPVPGPPPGQAVIASAPKPGSQARYERAVSGTLGPGGHIPAPPTPNFPPSSSATTAPSAPTPKASQPAADPKATAKPNFQP